jgi:hypothetical protein
VRTFIAVVVAVVVVATVGHGLFAWIWPQTRRDRVVRAFAAGRGLVLDEPGRAMAERLLMARRRGHFVGATVGSAAILGASWGVHELGLFRHWAAAIAGIALAVPIPQVAGTLGATAALRRAVPDAGDTRVAHVSAPSLDDFLPTLMRWYSVVLLAVSGLAVGVSLLVPASGPLLPIGRRGLVAGWLASACAVAAAELAARVVLRAPRPASSPAALAVQDEITGDLVAVVIAGALGPALVLGHAVSGIVPAAAGLSAWLGVFPVVAEGRRRRRVGQRLWRTPAAAGSAPRPPGAPGRAP